MSCKLLPEYDQQPKQTIFGQSYYTDHFREDTKASSCNQKFLGSIEIHSVVSVLGTPKGHTVKYNSPAINPPFIKVTMIGFH